MSSSRLVSQYGACWRSIQPWSVPPGYVSTIFLELPEETCGFSSWFILFFLESVDYLPPSYGHHWAGRTCCRDEMTKTSRSLRLSNASGERTVPRVVTLRAYPIFRATSMRLRSCWFDDDSEIQVMVVDGGSWWLHSWNWYLTCQESGEIVLKKNTLISFQRCPNATGSFMDFFTGFWGLLIWDLSACYQQLGSQNPNWAGAGRSQIWEGREKMEIHWGKWHTHSDEISEELGTTNDSGM